MTTQLELTPTQRSLARHALGLDSNPDGQRSYRNGYSAAHGSPQLAEWRALEAAGLAKSAGPYKATVEFWLTWRGAMLALDAGESLDPDDFSDAPG